MYKIIYGIPAMMLPQGFATTNLNEHNHIENYIIEDDLDVWCDFELDFIPETNKYKFCFETMLGFDGPTGCKDWINHCLDMLTEYMNKNNLDTTKELDLYTVFTDGVNVNTEFETIEDAYAWLKMIVHGFNGQGLSM